jgi:hypothetical protein
MRILDKIPSAITPIGSQFPLDSQLFLRKGKLQATRKNARIVT